MNTDQNEQLGRRITAPTATGGLDLVFTKARSVVLFPEEKISIEAVIHGLTATPHSRGDRFARKPT